MIRYLTILASGFWLLASVQAANWYVRPNGAGAKTGADWNNAWDSGGVAWSSTSGGDTVWMAGGNYTTSMHPTKSGTSGNPILIKRVLASDSVPSSAAGWSSSFDSQVVVHPSSGDVFYMDSPVNYVGVDGRVDQGIVFQKSDAA